MTMLHPGTTLGPMPSPPRSAKVAWVRCIAQGREARPRYGAEGCRRRSPKTQTDWRGSSGKRNMMLNRREFVCSTVASVLTFAWGPAAFATDYDLIIKGGGSSTPHYTSTRSGTSRDTRFVTSPFSEGNGSITVGRRSPDTPQATPRGRPWKNYDPLSPQSIRRSQPTRLNVYHFCRVAESASGTTSLTDGQLCGSQISSA